MSMKDTLKKAKIAAMKAKDKAKLNPINLTLADIQNLEIANGHEATDEEVLKVIQKGVKTRRETAKLYEDKGLADKAAPETAEADFLETFLPAAASAAGSWFRRSLSGQSNQAVWPKRALSARYRAYSPSQGLAAAKSRTDWASAPPSREKARRSSASRLS